MDSYVVVDLETTGLAPKRDRILEIGAFKIIDGKCEERFHSLVNPGRPIPERVVALTGIDDAMVAGSEPVGRVIREFTDFAGALPLLGHNLMFDYAFLKHGAVNEKLDFERSGVDTLKICRKLFPNLESRSLEAMCRYYHIEQERAHRAADDARVTGLLFERLKKDFMAEAPEVFAPKPLLYKAKKQSPITNAQKGYLNDLLKYHTIKFDVQIDSLTKSEASRLIDGIILQYGRIHR